MQNKNPSQPPASFPPHNPISGAEWYPRADPLPDIPIMPSTRLQLELLLQEPVLDLRAVSEVVLEDVGATLQILRLIGEEYAVEDERPIRIEDCIASLNAETWFHAVCASTLIQNSKLVDAWQHAKRIGYYAEQLATNEEGLRPGEGYLIGLLHEVGRLPELLGWQSASDSSPEGQPASEPLGALLAQHWHLPSCVVEATREQEAPGIFAKLLKAAHDCLTEDDAGERYPEQALAAMVEADSASFSAPLASFA